MPQCAYKMFRFHVRDLLHYLVVLYLFIADDFVSIVLPSTTCGITLSLAGGILQCPVSIIDIVPRVPLILTWVWINLLLFNMSNQSQPGAVEEDIVNKPWRPIASGRVSAQVLQRHIWTMRLVVLYMTFYLGGTCPSLLLQILTFWYNELNGGEEWFLRNFLNAGGYLCFIMGAMQVAAGTQYLRCTTKGLQWFFWTSVIISCTMHIQDLYDQEGDRLRSRRSIPLVFGDAPARFSIALPILFWSVGAPAFWSSSVFGYLPTVTIGSVLAMRLLERSKPDSAYDKTTFKYWNAWMISIHMLPVWTQSLLSTWRGQVHDIQELFAEM